MTDIREDMVKRLDAMHEELHAWAKENESALYASESDLVYEAMMAVTDLMNALNETLCLGDLSAEGKVAKQYRLGSVQERVFGALSRRWMTTREVADALGTKPERILDALMSLHKAGIIEKRMVDGTGRVRNRLVNQWRRPVSQEEGKE